MIEMLREISLNKWFFSFVIGWIAFLLLVDWSKLHINVWGGIISSIIQLLHDSNADKHNFYHAHDAGIWIFKSSAFFTFGLVFTMGVVFLQFLPRNPKLQLIHITGLSTGLLLFELIAVNNGLIEHDIWNYWGSFWDNVLVLGALAWMKLLVLYISGLKRR
jgi:hypothetical protein